MTSDAAAARTKDLEEQNDKLRTEIYESEEKVSALEDEKRELEHQLRLATEVDTDAIAASVHDYMRDAGMLRDTAHDHPFCALDSVYRNALISAVEAPL